MARWKIGALQVKKNLYWRKDTIINTHKQNNKLKKKKGV